MNINDVRNISKGVIFDTDVLIKLHEYSLLDKTIKLLHGNSIESYYPREYEYEAQRDLKPIINKYKSDNLLKDLNVTNEIEELKNKLMMFPFDKGEAYCYAFARYNNLIVVSNDKLAAYSYLVLHYTREILIKKVWTERLFEEFYANTVSSNGGVLRFDLYALLRVIHELSDSQIDNIDSRICRRSKEWFYPKDIAKENKWLRTRFKSEKSCYLSIGKVAASIYSLPKDSNLNDNFIKHEKYKSNIGLKIKSTSKGIGNMVLTKKVGDRRAYNFIAYNVILKYLRSNQFLIDYIENSNSPIIGRLKPDEFNSCKNFVRKFRCLYDMFRIRDK